MGMDSSLTSSSKKCASEIIVITMRLKSFILNCFFFLIQSPKIKSQQKNLDEKKKKLGWVRSEVRLYQIVFKWYKYFVTK